MAQKPKGQSLKGATVRDLVERSGNSFHARVVKLLRENNWEVMVSPYYSDNFTDKPREIDIIAERQFRYQDMIRQWFWAVNVRLYIECKYVATDTVFWFDNKDSERAADLVKRDADLGDTRFGDMERQHHYCSKVPVAKLFASERSRSEDNDAIARAINQNLNALVYYRHRSDLSVLSRKHDREDVLGNLSYPLIIVNSFERFHSTDMQNQSEIKAISEPFQLEVNYAYVDKDRRGSTEYFIIDVASLDTLLPFLEMIERKDVAAVMDKISWDKRRG